MLFAKKIIRLTPFLGLVCFITPTQAQINSPFSRYGLGNEILNNQNVNSQAMGGFSAAYTPSMNSNFGQSININNPATYGAIFMTTFDLGISYTSNTLKSTTPIARYNSAYLVPNYLAITAATITSADNADINKPNAILVAVVGSFFLPRSHVKKATTSGVNKITQPGFID